MQRQGQCPPGGGSVGGGVPCGHIGAPCEVGTLDRTSEPCRLGEPSTVAWGRGRAGQGEAFRLSENVNFTSGYFLWDLFLSELETLPNYVWVSFKAHKLHPVLLTPS
jgi:hypothetical protein